MKYKAIPGNVELRINLEKQIINSDGEVCTLPISNEKAHIEMYGKSRLVDLTWLSLIAHYEIDLPERLVDEVWTISFIKAHPRTKRLSGQVPDVRRPLVYSPGYRLVPRYFRYAVSRDGKVIDTHTNEHLAIQSHSYLCVYMRDPVSSIGRSASSAIPIHRLVALAWVKNTDPYEKWMVNHIDGNKHNPHYKNLEWVTPSENNNHAFENNLRSDNIGCRVRDVRDGSVVSFSSLTKACAYMGMPFNRGFDILKRRKKDKLLAEFFEIRKDGDDEPWYYEQHAPGTRSGRYHLHITWVDGTRETYTDLRAFIRKFNIWNTPGVENIKKKFESLFPGTSVELVDHFVVKGVQSLHKVTKEVRLFESMIELCRRLNLPRSRLQSLLKKKPYACMGDYIVRYETSDEWVENVDDLSRIAWCITATRNDEELKFDSLTSAAKYFNVDRSRIKRRLDTDLSYQGWNFKKS